MVETNRILLILGEDEVAKHLEERLAAEGGYLVSLVSSLDAGISALRQNNFDVIIAKFDLPVSVDMEIVASLKNIDPDCVIIAYLKEYSPQTLEDLSRMGIYDFITRPVNLERLLFLVKRGSQLHSLLVKNRRLSEGLKERNASLEKQNTLLTNRVEENAQKLNHLYEDLRSTYMRTIKVLAQAIDARDHYTHSHSENVARYAVVIASEMGLPAREIETIRDACELHDLGKIGVVDSILSKPGSLTEDEWKQIKLHPVTGAKILEPLPFLNEVVELVRQHHEHYDGTGYPDGKKGDDILLGARIIHLADAYETVRSARSYRKEPLTKEEAITEIKANSGTQFDPKVVEAFLKVVDRL
jgi:putative nucleotidyltransferase with HDIG domain